MAINEDETKIDCIIRYARLATETFLGEPHHHGIQSGLCLYLQLQLLRDFYDMAVEKNLDSSWTVAGGMCQKMTQNYGFNSNEVGWYAAQAVPAAAQDGFLDVKPTISTEFIDRVAARDIRLMDLQKELSTSQIKPGFYCRHSRFQALVFRSREDQWLSVNLERVSVQRDYTCLLRSFIACDSIQKVEVEFSKEEFDRFLEIPREDK
ncbi:MAG: hypothetical protein R3C53_26030 [Pirellulaceae bacterium]